MLSEKQKELVRQLAALERKAYTTQHICEILKMVYVGKSAYANLNKSDDSELEKAVSVAIYTNDNN